MRGGGTSGCPGGAAASLGSRSETELHLHLPAETEDWLLNVFPVSETQKWSLAPLGSQNQSSLSDLGLTPPTTGSPQRRRLSGSLSRFPPPLLVSGCTLPFPLPLRVSPGGVFSVGTGCGSAGPWRIVTGHFLLGDDVQRSRRPVLLSWGGERALGQGWWVRIRWWS